jgi:hypothetical protein
MRPEPEEEPFYHFSRGSTMPMTRQEIVSVLGPADEALIAEIVATGASLQELREA